MTIKTLSLTFEAYSTNYNFQMAFNTDYGTQNYLFTQLSTGVFVDPPMVQVLTQYLQSGDTFIDVGSHIGYYSLLARQIVGSAGRVIAFEPNPQAFSMFVLNSFLNDYGNLHGFNCALSNEIGTATFHIHQTNEGLSSLHTPVNSATSPDEKSITVTTMTLDQLHKINCFRNVKIVKIDVEGFEWLVFQGGSMFFRDCAPPFIVFEINNRDFPGVVDDYIIRRHFREMGYFAYLIRSWPATADTDKLFGNSVLLPLAGELKLKMDYGNILLSKHEL